MAHKAAAQEGMLTLRLHGLMSHPGAGQLEGSTVSQAGLGSLKILEQYWPPALGI
jgi:hypothetical protein